MGSPLAKIDSDEADLREAVEREAASENLTAFIRECFAPHGGQRGGIALALACDRVVRYSAIARAPYSQLNAQGLEDSENCGKLRIAGR